MAFVEYELLKRNDQERKKMLVLLDIFFILKCQRVDQTQKNTLHHSSRMFSIKGVLVWSSCFTWTPPCCPLSSITGGIICVFLKFSLLRSTINPPQKILKVKLFWFHQQNKCTPCSQHNVCNNSGTDLPSYVSLISHQMPPHPLHSWVNTESPGVFFFSSFYI